MGHWTPSGTRGSARNAWTVRFHTLSLAWVVGTGACVGDDEQAHRIMLANDLERADGGQSANDDPGATASAGKPLEIPLGVSAHFGAFEVSFDAVEISPRIGDGVLAELALPFEAFNRSRQAAVPLAEAMHGGAFLEINDEHHRGFVSAREVPGLKRGAGLLEWTVFTDEAKLADLRAAVVTLGQATQNQLVIDFDEPENTEGLAAKFMDGFTLQYRSSTFEFDELQLHYQDYVGNRPLPARTARLLLIGTISASSDRSNGSYSYWERGDFYLTLPGGHSRSTDSYLPAVHEGDSKSVEIAFDLDRPVAGTYTFAIAVPGGEVVTHELRLQDGS